jgi:hypothetical protein
VENCVILSEFEQNQDLMKDSSEFGVPGQGQRRLRDPNTKKWFPVKVIYFKKMSFLSSCSEDLQHWRIDLYPFLNGDDLIINLFDPRCLV